MARYLVTVTATPGVKRIDGRRINAHDANHAKQIGYDLVASLVSRRRIARYRLWWQVSSINPYTGELAQVFQAKYTTTHGGAKPARVVVRKPGDGA